MSGNLSPAQWARIHAFQQEELKRLASDAAFARRASLTRYYSGIGRWLQPELGGRVLELGCGPGRYVAILAGLGFDTVGVDPQSYPTWDIIKSYHDVDLRSGVVAEALPFDDGSFDHVACLGALLYFADASRALAEIHRLMKPGGRLIVRTVNRLNLYTMATGRKLDPASHNLYSQRELCQAISRAGFTVAKRFTFGFWPPVATMYWWYLLNGIISQQTQTLISHLTPPRYRHNIMVFATRD